MSRNATERLALFFEALRTRQGLLARAALGAPDPADPGLAAELAHHLTAELRPDGSVGSSAVATIWRTHELLDLGQGAADRGVAATLAWSLQRQGAPGAYGEGCDKVRHALRACEHWIRGFFSPAPASERLAPITFPNGKVFRAEPAARFAISCLALRAVTRAGMADRPEVRRHFESLRLLADGWTEWTGFFAPDVIVAGLHALALGGTEYRLVVERLVDLLAVHQRVDGSWPNADLFQTLEALLAAGLPAARSTVHRALPALEERQRGDGSFGPTAQQERALIGIRALVWAEGRP